MRVVFAGILALILLPAGMYGQGLFENASAAGPDKRASFQINGYARGAFYLGEYNAPLNSEIRSTYGEAALKLKARSGLNASFYSELRFRSGYEYGDPISEIRLREAYADLYLGPFELRAGKSVEAWGRADGINPTSNLTPRDYFVRSPEPDDMRLGNFILRARYNMIPAVRLEAVWVPVYKYSVYRFDLFEMPSYVRFSQSPLPSRDLKGGSAGVKLDIFLRGLDGSLSWFNGYDPMPGIQMGDVPASPAEDFIIDMYARAFRQQTLGLDFSFGLGSFGVRGEAALREPVPDYRGLEFVPNRDLRYVLGVDRSFGNFSLTAIYSGLFVFDFEEGPGMGDLPAPDPSILQDPEAMAALGPAIGQQIRAFNRIIFDQVNEWSHLAVLRPAVDMFHGVSTVEVSGMYNFSTEEWALVPRLSWKVNDNLRLSLGGEYFRGPANTRYDLIAPVFNGGFFELKYSF